MSNEPTDDDLRALHFAQSRIPPLAALEAFVAGGKSPSLAVQTALDRVGLSRWYPAEGGHRVLILYEGGWPFDSTELTVRPGAWDHDHCGRCNKSIPSMTLCWASVSDPLVLLCVECHADLFARSE